jgi:hypothetical protein
MTIDSGIQVILRHHLNNLRGISVGNIDGRDFLIKPLKSSQVAIYVPSLKKTGPGIRVIIRVDCGFDSR